MRPIWSGSLSFGLVNIPVKLYLAAKSERFSFRMLHAKDDAPVQFRRFCSAEEKEIPYDEIVRGYEYEKGQFLRIEDEDFERIDRPAAHTVDIQEFVGASEISPLFYEAPYYLEPTRGAERAYALLRAALKRSGRVGIARVALKEREYIAAVLVQGKALVMTTLRYAGEVRDANELNIPEENLELPGKQLDLALMLIEQLEGRFEPAAFKDTQREQTAEMIRQKLEGLPVPKRAAAGPPAQVVDLAEMLERSLREARRGGERTGEEEETGERRAPRQQAARKARSGRRK